MKRFSTAFFLLLFLPFLVVKAQVIPPSDEAGEDNIQYSIVPFAGYISDLGLIGGLLLQRFNYGGESDDPFLSNTKLDFTISTKGNIIGEFDYERTRSFGTDIRSRFTFRGERDQQSHYFGIGNRTEYSSGQYEDDFFFFESRRLSLMYSGRKQVGEFSEDGIIDLIVPVSFTFLDASSGNGPTRFDEDLPEENGSGWVNKIGIGLIADSRDSEFAPTRGFRYLAGIKTSPSFAGSDYTFSELTGDFRHYKEIFKDVVVAQKIQADHRLGSPPFWEMAALGSQDGLRGFHQDRFLGDSSILHLLELRTWLFSLWDGDIRLGGQLFWDTGRVFSNFDSARFFENWKHTFGAGGAMSLFNSDFILRGDIGFSEESARIYIGVGYVF
ncbi:MAG: BamA/TamA family outer membrane protein [Balneolaceae bacterium]